MSFPKQFDNNRIKVTFPDGTVHHGELTATLTVNNDPSRLSYEVLLDKPYNDMYYRISVPPEWVGSEVAG